MRRRPRRLGVVTRAERGRRSEHELVQGMKRKLWALDGCYLLLEENGSRRSKIYRLRASDELVHEPLLNKAHMFALQLVREAVAFLREAAAASCAWASSPHRLHAAAAIFHAPAKLTYTP